MRNTQAGEKAAGKRLATNSTLAGINLLVPRPLRRTKQAE